MAIDDYGIVVGITAYPEISPLQGTELDAEDFYDWLTSSTGGGVPPDRVDKIVSSDFQAAATGGPVKLPAQEVAQAFDRLHAAALGATGIPRRLGRRLYVYAAGHGAALPFSADPERSDAAFLVADATKFNATHVMTKVRALYFLNAGIFDEIAVFMDCCRNPVSITPHYPSYINATALDTLESEPRKFFAFATKWGLSAREKPFNGVTRGVFTTALVAGLKGAAAKADGTVTSSSLRDYLLLHMSDLLTDAEKADPFIPKRPDIPAPAVELVFATVAPRRVTVTVTIPAAAANQPIRIRGDGFATVAQGNTGAAGTWHAPDPLPRGGYLVEIPALNLEQSFTLVGDEGTKNVDL